MKNGNSKAPNVIAIIPARGGSKGIPQKNLRIVAGKPLVVHSVQQAKGVPEIDRVFVSTDDPAIAAVARTAGAAIIDRPSELSGDEASSESAILHVLNTLRASGTEPEVVVFLQATSPNRSPSDISGALEIFRQGKFDSLLSACPLHGFVWRLSPDGPESLSYDYRERHRRQDAPQDVVENGSIYVFKSRVLRETGNRLGGKIGVYLMDPSSFFQVDEPRDLELVEKFVTPTGSDFIPDFQPVRLLVLDFDGVFTDNRVLVNADGVEAVLCDRGDGLALADLRRSGFPIWVLSTERNPVVAARCEKLDLPFRQGLRSKRAALEELSIELGISLEEIVFVGNDVNDLECLRRSGIGVAVTDAHPSARGAADLVLSSRGGAGAVREICERIMESKGIWHDERGQNW